MGEWGGYRESTYADRGLLTKRMLAYMGEGESKILKFLRTHYVDGPLTVASYTTPEVSISFPFHFISFLHILGGWPFSLADFRGALH